MSGKPYAATRVLRGRAIPPKGRSISSSGLPVALRLPGSGSVSRGSLRAATAGICGVAERANTSNREAAPLIAITASVSRLLRVVRRHRAVLMRVIGSGRCFL